MTTNGNDQLPPRGIRGPSVVTLDRDELACRIAEAITETRRPYGMTADEELADLSDETRADMRRAAVRAIEYFAECISESVPHARH